MKGFHFSIAIIGALALAGCNDAGQRGCLGGGAVCNPSSTLQINPATVESNSSTAETTSSGFTCTATPYPSQVYPYQWLQVTIQVTGGAAGNKTITNFDDYVIPSFTNSATIVGEYYADKAGTVVSRTVELSDSSGATTSCDFQVSVLPANSGGGPTGSGLPACAIAVQESSLNAGDTAHFTFTAANTSSATFSNLYGSSSWLLDDSVIQTVSPLVAKAALTYSYAGPKTVTIEVSNANGSNTCSTSFVVGATGLNVTQTPPGPTGLRGEFNLSAQAAGITNLAGVAYSFTTTSANASIVQTGPNTARVTTNATSDANMNVVVTASGQGVSLSRTVPLSFLSSPPSAALTGCNVFVAPTDSGSQASAPVMANSPARAVIFPQGGVGPFSAGIASVTENGATFGWAADAAGSDPQSINFHFTQTGTPLVTAYLRDTVTGQVQLCSTYAISH